MGGASAGLAFSARPPTVILMAGLQGSGKTTATAKLALHLRAERGSSVALAACDTYRPAAVEQLVKVGAQAGADVYEQGTDARPGRDRRAGRWSAPSEEGKDVLIVDTSGRLHVDEELMAELVRDPRGGQTDRRAAGRRRDDRPGRRQRGRAVRRGGPVRRRGA